MTFKNIINIKRFLKLHFYLFGFKKISLNSIFSSQKHINPPINFTANNLNNYTLNCNNKIHNLNKKKNKTNKEINDFKTKNKKKRG